MIFLLFFLHQNKTGLSVTRALPLTVGNPQCSHLYNENSDSINFLGFYGVGSL